MIEIDFLAVSAVIGVLLPLPISLLKDVAGKWPKNVVKGFAFGAALIAAIVQTGVDLGWTTANLSTIVASFGIIFPLAHTTYKGLWQGTTVNHKLTAAFTRLA